MSSHKKEKMKNAKEKMMKHLKGDMKMFKKEGKEDSSLLKKLKKPAKKAAKKSRY